MYNSEEANRIAHISGANVLKCMRCGKCSATCPSYDDMPYHPHQFVYMVEKGQIDKLMEQTLCFAIKAGLLLDINTIYHTISS